jgi:hypothetical protein
METLQRTANRGSVSTGYDVANSLKFEDDNDERMYKAISSQNQRTFTVSLWLKRTELGYRRIWGAGASGSAEFFFYIDANDFLNIYSYASGAYQLRFVSNAVFRDTAAWYHFVFQVDTTQSTEANRFKIYVNGLQLTSFSTSTYPSQNADIQLTDNFWVGTQRGESPDFSGYITEFVYLDGTSAAQTDFGEFDDDSGIWKPKDVSGLTFGTNGFHLDFEDASNLGNDANGGTDFTLVNISSADQATDTCTNNFATLNPLFKYPSSQVINEGATKVDRTSGSGINKTFYATIPVLAGKFYFEAQPTEGSGTMIGVETITGVTTDDPDSVYVGEQSTAVGYYASNGQKFTGASGSSYGDSYGNSDIIGVALDMDNRKVYFAKNNTYQNSGDPTSGSTGTGAIDLPDSTDGYVFAVSYDSGGQWVVNFGGFTTMSISSSASDANSFGTFEYAPPTGYLALCTKNLASDGG